MLVIERVASNKRKGETMNYWVYKCNTRGEAVGNSNSGGLGGKGRIW